MRGDRARSVGAVVVVALLVLVAGCTPGAADRATATAAAEDGSAAGGGPADAAAPDIPRASEPPGAGAAADAAAAAGSAEAGVGASEGPSTDDGSSAGPAVGEHLLVSLEGPLTDAAATDVVLRTEAGEVLDRFRLPGAVDVMADPGARYALVSTLDGRWAVLDAVERTLGLVRFEGAPQPTTSPRVAGAVAWWPEEEPAWVLRLDDGTATALTTLLGEGVRVRDASADGTRLLVGGPRAAVLDTTTGEAVDAEPGDRAAMGADGATATVLARDGEPILVVQPPGEPRRVIAVLPALGTPVPLPGGRTAVLGTSSALVAADGVVTPLPTVAGLEGDPVVAADGRLVVAPTADGLVVLDVPAASAATVPGTAGMAPADPGDDRWIWAVSDTDAVGAVVLDTETGAATAVLEDLVTKALTSRTPDGHAVVLATGPGGTAAHLVRADGTATALAPDATAVDAAVHPGGDLVAVAVVEGGVRTVLVGDPDDPQVLVETGRTPAWLRTGG